VRLKEGKSLQPVVEKEGALPHFEAGWPEVNLTNLKGSIRWIGPLWVAPLHSHSCGSKIGLPLAQPSAAR
jgi:hypothetical protein